MLARLGQRVASLAPPPQLAPSLWARSLCSAGSELMTGTCKWWDNVKGFGFITIDGQERDVRTVSQKSHPRGLPMPASLQQPPGSRVTSQRRSAGVCC
jgi:hypothetical protein